MRDLVKLAQQEQWKKWWTNSNSGKLAN